MFRSVIVSFIFFFLLSCEEIGPVINTSGNGDGSGDGAWVDSTQQKNVLLEDFTATNCPNCPKGRAIIDDLIAEHPGRIHVVEVHQGPLSVKMLPDDPLLKTEDGESLAAYLGPPPFWPSGAVSRLLWETSPGTFERLVGRNYWKNFAEQELNSPLQILLGIDFKYNETNRALTGTVTINYLTDIIEAINMTVLITESGIIAGQLDGLTLIPEYEHEDVLRDIITNYSGEFIGGNKTAGSSWNYKIPTYAIPADWNPDNCHVTVFVSKSVGTYDVLQVLTAPIK